MEHTRLRVAREQAGLSRARLAALSGVAPETIERLERRHNQPRVSTLRALASAMQVPVTAILDDVTPDARP